MIRISLTSKNNRVFTIWVNLKNIVFRFFFANFIKFE